MKNSPRSHLSAERGLPPTPESWLPNEHSLYRPRHSRRQRAALTCALVFFLAPTVAFVSGVHAEPFENRALHPFPSLSDGWGFFSGLGNWATDHLSLRQAGVRAANDISTDVFGDPQGAGRAAPTGPIGVGPQTTPDKNAYVEPPGGYPSVITGQDGWFYLGADVSNKCKPAMGLDQVINALQRLRAAVVASGRRFELVIAPDKSTAIPEHLPPSYAGKDCSRTSSEQFWNRAVRELGIIDVRGQLDRTAQQVGHPLYEANDTHWTYEGGAVMTYALADRITPGVTGSWVVAPQEVQAWPADIPLLLGRSESRELRKYSLAPDGGADRTQYVASDFRTPLKLTQLPDDRPASGVIGAKVGLIADSFTQFATPFLAAGFADLTIVHGETLAQHAAENTAQLLADRDVITVELAERNVVGGGSPLLQNSVIEAIATTLAQNPR